MGGEAAPEASVIDVIELVAVLAHEPVAGEEEGVITRRGGVDEEGCLAACPGRQQVEATAVLGLAVTGAGALGLPLIDILAGRVLLVLRADRRAALKAIRVSGKKRVGGFEEDAVAAGRKRASESRRCLDGEREEGRKSDAGRGTDRRGTGRVAGDAE